MNTLGKTLITIAGATAVTAAVLMMVGEKTPVAGDSKAEELVSSGDANPQAEKPLEKRLPDRATAPIAPETPVVAVSTSSAGAAPAAPVQAKSVSKAAAEPIAPEKPVAAVTAPSSSNAPSTPSKVEMAAKNHTDSQIAAAASHGKISDGSQAQQSTMVPDMQMQMRRPVIEMPAMPAMPTPPQLPVPARFFQMPQFFGQQVTASGQ